MFQHCLEGGCTVLLCRPWYFLEVITLSCVRASRNIFPHFIDGLNKTLRVVFILFRRWLLVTQFNDAISSNRIM
jgi:hypothetical protein